MSTREVRFQGVRARAAAALVAVCALVIGVGAPLAVQVAEAPPAGAHCPVGYASGGLVPAGNWGQEWNYAYTCDWDNSYHGWLVDVVNDGSCVWSEFIDAGIWNVQAYACTTGAWVDYWWNDRNGDSYSWINLCRNQGCFTTGYWPWNYGY